MSDRGVTVLRGGVHDLAATAHAAEAAGYGTVWTPEFYTRSAVVTLAAMAAQTQTCRLGTSIAYATGRSPLMLATEARSLDELTGGRLVLGLGTGTKRMMEDWHSLPGEAPAVRMEELVPLLRAIWRLHEAPVDHEGRFYRTKIVPTAEVGPPLRADIPVYTAGVNPRMVQVAGRVADGLLGHPLFSRAYVDDVVHGAIDEGRRKGERPDAEVTLVGILICAVDDEDPDRARREVAQQLAFYCAPKSYGGLLDVSGFGSVGETVREAFGADDHDAMAAAVPEEMVTRMAAAGTAAEVRARIAEAEETFDHVVLYPPSFGLDGARCEQLIAALTDELAPSHA